MLALVAVLLLCNILAASSQTVAVATFNNGGLISGNITFTAIPAGLQVQVWLTGLSGTGSTTHPWHVHDNPLNGTSYPAVCDYAVGLHFDPYNNNWANQTGSPTYSALCAANASLCEAGDLSGKFKVFPTNGSSGNGAFSDTYLDTTGTLSVADCVGRSVVIHNVYPNPPASSRNRECANITAVTTPTSAPTGGSQAVMDGAKLVALVVLMVLAIA